ncbi:MAG TPA: 1-phosphofructokinase family hexose kinase [Flavisolibacter sp.]|nr:1-phosphofructokinase family hexose kinase [Flavisolibacter sp.]
MSKIITVTFNPAIDKSTAVPSIRPDKKLRCTPPVFEPGGGGLNVSRAITKLGGKAPAVYLAGGHSGKFLQELMEAEGVESLVVETKTATRENLIVVDAAAGQQFRFGMPGSEVREEECTNLLRTVEKLDANFIVASGSLPPGIPTNIFGRLAAIARKKGASLIVDTSGEALRDAVDEGVFLFKPNLGELSSLVGREELHQDEVDDVARELLYNGRCRAIVVSMGPAGARLITKEEAYQAIPPVVKQKSTVGAGDSMVAGMVLRLSQGGGLREALQYGVACGTAATMNHGTELCKKQDVERLIGLIRMI